MPAEMPHLPADFTARLRSLAFPELAQEVIGLFLGAEVPPDALTEVIRAAFDFPIPLVSLTDRLHILELFHGPTLAFKDFGARFMARLMGYFVREMGGQLTVIVATSGDTGSGVAHAFLGVPGISVVILYPAGRVTEAQEKQFTTLGQNITALEVAGSFDDCQRLAKQALVDPLLRQKVLITSANSINIGRLIPQMFYYFAAFAQLPDASTPVVFSVPSGNFGNLTGGLFAKRIDLPVAQFIAATNANDVVPEFLRTGHLIPRASQHTLSNAMDVGNPSNFARIVDLYDNDLQAIRRDIWGCGFSDEETLRTMRELLQRTSTCPTPTLPLAF
jgi:threonine synthase